MPLVTEIQVVGVEDVTQKLIEYFNAYKQGTQDIQTLNEAMRQTAAPIYGMRRSLMLLRTEWRVMHAVWIEGARVMRDIGRIGRNVTQIWTAWTVGQIRLENASRNYREACEEVAKAQQEYNEYLEAFGEASIYTKEAYERLQEAIERQRDAEQQLQRAQQETIIGYIGIALQIGDIIGTIPTMILHIHMLQATMKTASIAAKTLTASLGTIGAVLAGFAAGVMVVQALTEAFGQTGAAASAIIGVLVMVAAILAKMALSVSILSFGGAALAGIAAFGAAMAAYGAYSYATYKPKQYGGYIPETGLYLLHAGEYVVPKHETHKTTKMINATINQYVTVTKEVDWTIASRRAIDQLIEELGEKSW